MKSLNPKNQGKLNKALKALIRYNALNNLRDNAENGGEQKEYKKLDKLCQNQWDKFQDYLNELPKAEQKRIEKSIYY